MSQPIISKANLKAYFDYCDGTGKGKVRMTYWPEVYIESLYYHTSFIDEHRPDLEESKKLPERKYCLKNNIFHPPMCVFCGEDIRKFDFKNTHGYRPFCVSNCSHKPKDKQKQQEMIDNNPIEESLVDDFYVPMTWEETIEMIKEHLMDENYHFMSNCCNRDYMFKNGLIHLMEAIEHYAHDECEEYLEKLYAVYHGYEERPYCSNCGVKKVNFGIRKNETKKGYLKFCSRDCSYSSEERISNSMKTIEERYGVSNVSHVSEVREKISDNLKGAFKDSQRKDEILEKRRNTSLERYGVEQYNKTDDARQHLRNKQKNEVDLEKANIKREETNLERYGGHPMLVGKNEQAKELLYDYDWLYDQYVTQKKPFAQIAKELGVNWTWVQERVYSFNIELQQNYVKKSVGEQEVFEYLENIGVENIESSNRTVIRPLELDIYCPDDGVAIEYCGIYYHSDATGTKDDYHKRKFDLCKEKGIRLITLFEDEWIFKKDLVKTTLSSLFNKDERKRVNARDCSIVDVSFEEYSKFLEQNHMLGTTSSGFRLGLIDKEGELVSVMGFKRSSEQDSTLNDFVLDRFCSSCNVRGAFSKLLSYFKRNHQWLSIKTFADKRWSLGDLYAENGFGYEGDLAPDYFYVSGNKRIDKRKFRMKNERTEAKSRGYHRIYDCGKMIFKIQNK